MKASYIQRIILNDIHGVAVLPSAKVRNNGPVVTAQTEYKIDDGTTGHRGKRCDINTIALLSKYIIGSHVLYIDQSAKNKTRPLKFRFGLTKRTAH